MKNRELLEHLCIDYVDLPNCTTLERLAAFYDKLEQSAFKRFVKALKTEGIYTVPHFGTFKLRARGARTGSAFAGKKGQKVRTGPRIIKAHTTIVFSRDKALFDTQSYKKIPVRYRFFLLIARSLFEKDQEYVMLHEFGKFYIREYKQSWRRYTRLKFKPKKGLLALFNKGDESGKFL